MGESWDRDAHIMNKKLFTVFILLLSLLGIGADSCASVSSHYESQLPPSTHQLADTAKTGVVQEVGDRRFSPCLESCRFLPSIQQTYHLLLIEEQKTNYTALLENKKRLLNRNGTQLEMVFRFKHVIFPTASELHSA